MSTRRKKYAKGTGPMGYIPSPNEAIAENDIVLAKAQAKADSNVWANTVIPFASSLLQSAVKGGIGQAGGVNTEIGNNTIDYTSPDNGASQMGLKGSGDLLDIDNFLAGNYNQGYAALGDSSAEGEIEAEGGEVIQTPQGDTATLQGPSHEEGGIPMSTQGDPNAVNIPPGTQIFSDRVKGTDGKTMAKRKELRDKRKAKLEEMLSKNSNDKLRVNAYTKTLKNLEVEEANDLDIQEKASMMADILGLDGVNEFAYGTGKRGVVKYNNGTGQGGVDPYPLIKYSKGYGFQDFKSHLDNFTTVAGKTPVIDWEDPEAIKAFQTYVGTKPDGILGKDTLEKADKMFAKTPTENSTQTKNATSVSSYPDADGDGVPDSIDIDSMNPAIESTTEVPLSETSTISSTPSTTEKPSSATPSINGDTDRLSKIGDSILEAIPNVSLGDAFTLYGTYKSAIDPLNNVNENRAGDQPNINHFRNFGKDAINKIQNQKQYVEGQKQEALMRTTRTANASKKATRNSARGVNTQRALDLAADLNKNAAESDIYSNFANQMMSITGAEANMELAQDEAVMSGEERRDLADRQDRDNYYTQRGVALVGRGQGIQQMGKNINEIKMNQMKLKLLESLGEYVTMDANGNIIAKKQVKTN